MTTLEKLTRNLFIPILIIIIATLSAMLLALLRTSPPQSPPKAVPAIPVVVESLSAAPAPIPLEGYGTLQAREEIQIVPEVSGRVTGTHPKLETGLKLKQGELIFSITDDEYKHRLAIEEASLAKAEFDLKEEQGRGLVAQREWKLLDKSLKNSSLSKSLALRKAHEQQKVAAISGAEGSLALAKLNVSRTKVTAPCDGVILEEQVGVGQFVNKGTQAATIACTDALKLVISLPPDNLRWLTPIEPLIDKTNANVEGHAASLIRLLSNVDQQTRMIRLLFELPGAALEPSEHSLSPLLLGSFSKVEFTAYTDQPLFTIPEDSIRNNNEIWLMDNNTLKIASIKLVYRYQGFAMVEISGNPKSIQLITSYINAPYEGMQLESMSAETLPSSASKGS